MAVLIVPPLTEDDGDPDVWPTLGDQVAEWLEQYAVWGPGSKFGKPVSIDDEFYSWLLRAYQVHPHSHERAGRRRFGECSEEKAKGTGKTEHAVIIGQAELNPTAPVRTVGWEKRGKSWLPVGGGVPYPRLIFLATSESQVMRTAFGRFRETLKRSPLSDQYHITQEKIIVLGESDAASGEAYPLPASPDSADGDLPTWQHIDEPHRWTATRHHETMDAVSENALKDVDADAWMMTTSTAGIPGEDSVEEQILHTAEAVLRGEIEKPGTFFYRRHCPDDPEEWPLETVDQVRAAVIEARGPAAEWSGDIERIAKKYFEPKTDRQYWERVWLNRWKKGAGQAFDMNRWNDLVSDLDGIPAGDFITLGFDGARRRDATVLVATSVETGLQEVLNSWERPLNAEEDWEVPAVEVDEAVKAAFDRFEVWRMYADPPYWDEWINAWSAVWPEAVVAWWTNRRIPMAHALRKYAAAQLGGTVSHLDQEILNRHIANSIKRKLPSRDEQDIQLWLISKERADSPNKIDAAMASTLSWEARMDAIAEGAAPAADFETYSF